jgi:hypothetical protein
MERTIVVAIVADLLRLFDPKMLAHQKYQAQTYAAPLRLHVQYRPGAREMSLVVVFPNHHTVAYVRYEVIPDGVPGAIKDIIEENSGDWIVEVERQTAELEDKVAKTYFDLGRNWK